MENESRNRQQKNVEMRAAKRVPLRKHSWVKDFSSIYYKPGTWRMLSNVIILNILNGFGLAEYYTMLIFVSAFFFLLACFIPELLPTPTIRMTHKNEIYS